MNRIVMICFLSQIFFSTAAANIYPIIFIHGLGGSARPGDDWNQPVFMDMMQNEYHYTFGGIVRNGRVSRPGYTAGAKSFFLVEFSDPGAGIKTLANELAMAVASVRQITRQNKVVLCGFSMGGIVAREYLTAHFESAPERVHKLVTLSSPHLGSPFAVIFEAFAQISEEIEQLSVRKRIDRENTAAIDSTISKLTLRRSILKEACRLVAPKINLSDPALSQLYPPQAGNTLQKMQIPHPKIQYVSIICVHKTSLEETLISLIAGLTTGSYTNFTENLMNHFKDLGAYVYFGEPGDHVVSASSQNIGNVVNIMPDKGFYDLHIKTFPENAVNASHTEAIEKARIEVIRAISTETNHIGR